MTGAAVVLAVWALFVVWVVMFVADEIHWHRRQRDFDQHCDEALEQARQRHPSGPNGPEDEPGWAEWKERH